MKELNGHEMMRNDMENERQRQRSAMPASRGEILAQKGSRILFLVAALLLPLHCGSCDLSGFASAGAVFFFALGSLLALMANRLTYVAVGVMIFIFHVMLSH